MSNKRNAFILAAGLAVGGAANANCDSPSCGGGNTGGSTQTTTVSTSVQANSQANNTTNVAVDTRGTVGNINAGGGTGTATVGNVTAGGANVSVDTRGTVGNLSTGASTATSTVNTAGTVGAVTTGTQNQSVNTAGTVGAVTTGTQNQSVNTAGTVGAVTTGPSTASTAGSGNSNLTLNQNYQASKAAIHLGGQNATVVVNDCVYARNIALGLSIADEAAAQVTIPLGASMVKGCGELKAELMTINGANAPEATPAQILLGVKTAGKMAPNTVGAAFTEMTKPANAEQIGNELALFTRAPREVLVQAPAAAAPADAKSATTVTLNFHGAAAPQAAAPANFPPCNGGKWVGTPNRVVPGAISWECKRG